MLWIYIGVMLQPGEIKHVAQYLKKKVKSNVKSTINHARQQVVSSWINSQRKIFIYVKMDVQCERINPESV